MEPKVLELASSGDKESQKKVFEELYGKLHGISMRYADSSKEASEFTTEIFKIIFDRIKSERPIDLIIWARSIAIDYCCKEIISRPGILSEMKEDVNFEKNASNEVMLEMIRELPSKSRVIFNLVVIDDRELSDVAKMFNAHISFVEDQRAKASNELKHKMASLSLN